MRLVLMALILASAPSLPFGVASATAQTSTQANAPSSMNNGSDYKPKQAVLAEFADCAMAAVPQRVGEFLATMPATREEAQQLRRFVNLTGCTNGRAFVSARAGEMRGAMADAFLRREPTTLSALAAREAAPAQRIAERAAGTRPFVIAYGKCLAGAVPAQAVALLATPYGSDMEKQALVGMGDALTKCMPEGVAYKIDIRDVRNHVADALYQMSLSSHA